MPFQKPGTTNLHEQNASLLTFYNDDRKPYNLSMPESKPTKERLIKRRDEINEQLNRVNDNLRIELERDEEEQAIQIEQDEVAISMENNLRRELAVIEDQLLNFGREHS